MNSFLRETDCLERFKTNLGSTHLESVYCIPFKTQGVRCFVYSGNQGNIIIMFHKRHLLSESCIYTQLFLFRADVVT